MEYDLIIVGGGLGGAALARAMAENGARVLVIERERQFKDRVRGEAIWPWGVAELRELGVYQLLIDTCAREVKWFDIYLGGIRTDHRDLTSTTPQQTAALNWVHHEMEEVMLQAAGDAGAEVLRGARACGLKPGARPSVSVEDQGQVVELHARLVVGADGRKSPSRKWANFPVQQDSYGMVIAGVLLEAIAAVPADANHWIMAPSFGQFAFVCPLNGGRMRAYAFHPREKNYRWQGTEDLARFVEESVNGGAPAQWYESLRPIGPLASFDGTDSWVEHPYQDGIALIGDAAASSDPSYGQGQSLTVRDVRVLRDQLLAHRDWDTAGHAYAVEHDRYHGAVHELCGWVYKIFYEHGPEAEARRARAMPLLAQDATRMPDVLLSGPEIPLGETARRRFFGED